MKYWEWEDELGQKYKEGISNCDVVFFGYFFPSSVYENMSWTFGCAPLKKCA